MPDIGLDLEQMHTLNRISSIGADNSAFSLSIMLNRRVDITAFDVVIDTLGEIPRSLGGEDKPVNAVHFSLSGKISGALRLVIPASESVKLAAALTHRESSGGKKLDENGVSALKELGNIVIGAYVTAFADELGLKIMYSVPEFVSGTLAAILDGIPEVVPLKSEPVVIVENKFAAGEDAYGTHLIFIPDIKSLAVMLKTLGVLEKQTR